MPGEPLLSVRHLSKTYSRRKWWGVAEPGIEALLDVSFTLQAGRTLAIAGPSGSGKTTLARCLANLETPSSGEILFQGMPLEIQLIPQQPAASLNPRFSAAEIVEEPLLIQRRGTAAERRARAAAAFEQVGLSAAALHKSCRHFSGGEKQRLAIARTLVIEPRLIVLDESLTGLDPGLQEQVASLLRDLQARLGLTYIVITHDLALATALAAEIAIMDRGRLVEYAPTAGILNSPSHPLTRQLLAAAAALAPPSPAA